MKMRLITTTAIGVAFATAAFAQSPNRQPADKNPPAAQTQPNNSAGSTAPQQNSSQPAQGGQAANPPASGTGQSAGSTTPPANSNTTSQAPASGTSPSQAQTAPSQPSSQQSANPPPANANQAPGTAGTTAQQPNASGNAAQQQPGSTTVQQPSTAQSSSQTNVNASVNINDQQRTRISQSIARLDVKPMTTVNFSISVGTVVPRDVHLATLPADVVEIVPQYRGYSFFVVKDEIVIVEPSSYKIVATLPYSGSSTAAAPMRERSKTTFSDRDREVIRKHSRSEVRPDRRTEGRTTGSAARTEIRIGERVPESVEIETFPDTVYRDAPALREYRYIHRDNRTYVIEPRERMIIEEID